MSLILTSWQLPPGKLGFFQWFWGQLAPFPRCCAQKMLKFGGPWHFGDFYTSRPDVFLVKLPLILATQRRLGWWIRMDLGLGHS